MSASQTELERLEQSGNEHYGREEYSIAVECYRAAMEHGMKAHSPLFNYAYSLAEIGDDTKAAQIYQKAIAAGSGSNAHNNLGNCYRKLGMLDIAHAEYLKAIKLIRTNPLYWRNLAVCLADLKDQDGQLNALLNVVKYSGATARDWCLLGCALDREKNSEEALVAFRKAAYLDADACYFTNMALMHSRLGQILDAYHAYCHALKLNATYATALTEKTKIKAALKHPQQSLHLQAAREIGPHDYVNPYALLDLTETDEQPEANEWFDQPTEWEELLGSLTRRRRALKAELELNDGALGWLPKLNITDEVVHRVLADLDDDGWHANHWAVFRTPMLKRFLMYGELDYFYSQTHAPYPLHAEIAGADTDDDEHEIFIEFISPFFSHRLTASIKASFDASNYEAITALFATRLPVTATDYDEALEPVRRHFARRRELLDTLKAKLEHSAVKDIETELAHASSEAKFLNILPAQHGAKLREDMCRAYRSISIALANHRDDYVTSERVLKAAEHFNVSETTKGRLAEDRTTVEELIRRENEKKKGEASLSLHLKLKSWFRERTLEITPTRFSWGEESISAEKVKAVRFGITIKYTNGRETGADSILAVCDVTGKVIQINWLGEENFSAAVQSVLGLYSTSILTGMISVIERGEMVSIGAVKAGKQGLGFETGVFTSKLQMIPWNKVVVQQSACIVHISSNTDTKAKMMLSTRHDWNACMVTTLVEIMKSSSK
jgi:tetratricopeptide (TPR) repeat protein